VTDDTPETRIEPVADFLRAVGFLTRIPVQFSARPSEKPLAQCAWAFPLTGLLVGGIGGAAYLVVAEAGVGGWPAALVAVATAVLITGALHEDGLADVADGFGGGRDRDAKLAIMRDSRIGTYGTIALIVAIGVRAAALAAIVESLAVLAALVAAAVFSRTAMAFAMAMMSPARDDGLGATAGRPGVIGLTLAAVFGLAIPLLVAGIEATGAVVVGAAFAACVGVLARRQIGGQTGDVLGAVQQAAEIGVLLALASA
jgi:adenosylcobinamide-GDP ribazoletransferase